MAHKRDDSPNPYQSPASPPGDQDPNGWQPLVPGEVLRVEGVLSPTDLFHANKLKGNPRPADSLHLAVIFLMLALGMAVPAITVEAGLALLAVFFLALALGFGSAGLRAARRVDRYWRERRGVFRFRRIEITEHGIRQQTEDESLDGQWNVFATYTASKRVVILDFDPPDAPMYYSSLGRLIIPRELFLCDADWDRFVRLVRAKLPKKYRPSRANEPAEPGASPRRDVAAFGDGERAARQAPSQGEIIRIEGTLCPRDLADAGKLAGKEKPSDAIGLVATFSLLSLGNGVACVVTRAWGGLFLSAILLVCAVALGPAAFVSARRIGRYWRSRRGIFRPQRVEITEDAIRHEIGDRSAAYRWSAFSQYAASKRVLILHFDPPEAFMHSMRGYLILARGLFASDADWERFVRLVGRKLPKKYREKRASAGSDRQTPSPIGAGAETDYAGRLRG